MQLRIQCRCGALTGELRHSGSARRIICYCKDCQAYARRLKAKAVLDANGGTEIIGTQARNVTFTGGIENLACASLTENGLLRWYAHCCNTPIANTPRDWRFTFSGVLYNCLQKPLEDSFPHVDMHVNNQSAIGTPPKPRRGQFWTLLGFMPQFMQARFTGSYKQTPFFTADGKPVVGVELLAGKRGKS